MSYLFQRASISIFFLVFAGFFIYAAFSFITIFVRQDIMEVELVLSQPDVIRGPLGADFNTPLAYLTGREGGNAVVRIIRNDVVHVNFIHLEEVKAFINSPSFFERSCVLLPQLLWALVCSFSFFQLYLFLKEIRGNLFFSQGQTRRLRKTGIAMLAYVVLQYLCQSFMTPVFIIDMEAVQARWHSPVMIAGIKKYDYYLWLLGGIVFCYLAIAFKRGEVMEEEQKYIL
ncbi:hypothetical protein [Filimonas effusa]|uniref:DUF2975 domain-containing protein n=1 Tax=Filimonas effusa TaxID=2508721 RepID=A0A4Q1DA69_9BACT|nr:hypothetical protein [Filimonas effusa]RXK85369.1 hypothetical protein ESB13_00655 [Filimonas effusa]